MKKNSKLDPIKAFAFLFTVGIISTIIVITNFIPDIKKLKISQMTRDKTAITLEQVSIENSSKKTSLEKIRTDNIAAINALENKFLTNKFHDEISGYFSQIEINRKSSTVSDGIETKRYLAKAELKDPTKFYDFVESLTKSAYAVGVEFPIHIKADENYNLTLEFDVVVHNLVEENK